MINSGFKVISRNEFCLKCFISVLIYESAYIQFNGLTKSLLILQVCEGEETLLHGNPYSLSLLKTFV